MKHWMAGGVCLVILTGASLILFAQPRAAERPSRVRPDQPQFESGNRLVRPANYREWIYLSSGLGMQYGAAAGQPQNFTNVFVEPGAYRQFRSMGHWPDRAIFVVEERAASSRGSINKAGHYQTDLTGLGVEVKDAKRFPDRWAYYFFGPGDRAAALQPKAACWQCHEEHAAVEHTFVQFYPTLLPVARKFGTYDGQKAGVP